MAKVTQVRSLKPQFDPNKTYKWDPNDIFEIVGQRFASVYHCLSQDMTIVGGAPLHLRVEAYNAIMEVFRQGVEQGVIVENGDIPREVSQDLDDEVQELFDNKNGKK